MLKMSQSENIIDTSIAAAQRRLLALAGSPMGTAILICSSIIYFFSGNSAGMPRAMKRISPGATP